MKKEYTTIMYLSLLVALTSCIDNNQADRALQDLTVRKLVIEGTNDYQAEIPFNNVCSLKWKMKWLFLEPRLSSCDELDLRLKKLGYDFSGSELIDYYNDSSAEKSKKYRQQ
jgi:hypothetical protein